VSDVIQVAGLTKTYAMEKARAVKPDRASRSSAVRLRGRTVRAGRQGVDAARGVKAQGSNLSLDQSRNLTDARYRRRIVFSVLNVME